MKETDLMVGDYVKFPIGYEKIQEISYQQEIGGYCVWFAASATLFPSKIEDIEPIPLTPEILEKNGFDISDPEVKQYHFTENGQKYHFSLRQMYNQEDGKPNGYSFYAFNVLTIIDFVHQLQHALKLCGIEKEINL